ncbi:hypothetical protein ACFQZF_13985 [Flavobacterium myungsuense]
MNLGIKIKSITSDGDKSSIKAIKKVLPNMFLYLKDDKKPNTTNSLELFFGHLKGNLNVHRGLSLANLNNFLKWFLYNKN